MLVLNSAINFPELTKSLAYEPMSLEEAYIGPIVGSFSTSVQKLNILFVCSWVNPCKSLLFSAIRLHFDNTFKIRWLAIIVSWYGIYTIYILIIWILYSVLNN